MLAPQKPDSETSKMKLIYSYVELSRVEPGEPVDKDPKSSFGVGSIVEVREEGKYKITQVEGYNPGIDILLSTLNPPQRHRGTIQMLNDKETGLVKRISLTLKADIDEE